MYNVKKQALNALIAASALSLAACGGSSSGGAGGGSDDDTGSFSLAVTDAPVDVASQVVVSFSGVSIQPADGELIEFMFEQDMSIDLLALQGSASESLLTDEEIPAGDYEWIRLHVNAEHDGVLDSYIELNTGNQLELAVPSGAESGLQLVSGFTVNAGGSVDFTIDFDLRKSVILPPTDALSGALLRPALRLIDNNTAGSIAGSVDSEVITEYCEDPANQKGAVYVYSGADATLSDVRGSDNDPLITALVNETGGDYSFEAAFLSEGEYTVAYTCGAVNDDPEAEDSLVFVGATNATVEADAETEVNFTVESEVSTGTMSMDVTDSPVDSAAKVVVQFDGVEIVGSGETQARLIAFDEPKSVDLLSLQGSNSAELFINETLNAGTYEAIRLMITAEADGEMTSYIEYDDGNQAELVVPGGAESGLTLHGPFEVDAGGEHAFVVDFDLRKSVISTPNDTFLRPALRIVDKATATHINGEVDADTMANEECAVGASVYVFAGSDAQVGELGSADEPLATANVQAAAEGEYGYEVGFLEPGDYTLALTCQADLDDPENPNDGIEFKQQASLQIEANLAASLNFNLQ